MKSPSPLRAIRLKCLDCCGTAKAVKFCTADGVHSTRCPLWPLRFGVRPATAAKRYGDAFLTPGRLPDARTPLAGLP